MGGPASLPVTFEPGVRQIIDIDFGALHASPEAGAAEATSIVIRLNGRVVLDAPVLYYPCDPGTIAIGLNAIQASTALATFSGSLLKAERLPER
jgi:hypothetical protein